MWTIVNHNEKIWTRLKSDVTSVVEVSRGTTTEARAREIHKDDHYPVPQGIPKSLHPCLSMVAEDAVAESNTSDGLGPGGRP